jgi:hypothetical protein
MSEKHPCGVKASRPVNDLDPGDCPELNLSNYDAEEVAELNGWAVQADACIERLTRERNEFHTQAQHAQAEIREAHAAMDAAGFPRLQPSNFPYSLTGRVRAGTHGVGIPPAVTPKNDDDALLIDNLFRACLGRDSMAVDTARMALRQRMNELRAAGVMGEDKWAMLARTGHLSQEAADAARECAAGVGEVGRGND